MDIILKGCMGGTLLSTRYRINGRVRLNRPVTLKPMPTSRYFCVLGIKGGPVNTVF